MGFGEVTGSRDTYGGYRARLVEQLRTQGIRDLAVLRAFAATPRHLFVPEAVRHRAYEDAALPIGNGQTISQPFTQARYLETLALKGKERDRKSTRLNSSHPSISYAVFCLKKKKKIRST